MMIDHDQYKARQREILQQLYDDSTHKHYLAHDRTIEGQERVERNSINAAATALDELMLEVVGEDDGSSLAEFARNKLRDSIRAVIKGGKH